MIILLFLMRSSADVGTTTSDFEGTAVGSILEMSSVGVYGFIFRTAFDF